MANQGISLHLYTAQYIAYVHSVYNCYNERVSLQNSRLNKKFGVLSVEWVLTDTRKHIRIGVCREAATAYFNLVVNVYFVIKVMFAASRFLLP